ncbi:MAG: hypothetical protein LBC84_02380 [Prevotellaceae bacterium]|jgi:hypothetical protein|nr:hypothetical protein [Prevotellaceae bacterium]
MACTVRTVDGTIISSVEIVGNKEKPIIYSDDGERCISIADVVKTNKTSIHILLARSDQVSGDSMGRNDFNFQCVKKVADAINNLGPEPYLIKVTPSRIDDLENSLSPSLFSDIELIMWGDHSGSPNETEVTGVFASGSANDWIYVHYNTTRGHYLTKGHPGSNNDNPKAINLKMDIKLINYGCYGNTSYNQRRFNNVFGEGNYLGKYNGQSKDRIITLDMINDLLTIGMTYAHKLGIKPAQLPELLDDVFSSTLRSMKLRKEGRKEMQSI